MFQLFHHHSVAKVSNQIYAPVDGEVIDLIKVKDPVFAQHTLGQGFGVIPSDGFIYAPVSGQVTLVASTKHAIYFKMANGLDVLLHMGLNTADLHGQPFRIHVTDGQQVNGGQRIASMNRLQIKAAGMSDTVVVVITNSAEKLDHLAINYGPIFGGHRLGTATVKG
ncbi:PTS sugar transporter subunit IIA [Lapidilactobacillus wuchangensis]|uniref:PTS sugar transporter subunit IIA n=1 Tax=Lapidilactobacillus wuchangensis TaxID=2486001 RepID=UPI000F7843A4|nr:PTS glucose transporter subunit IIA [Lapidilactobacillus wuchangensis]